ncbi:MAG: carboxypeptidase regulatory-like domain-containing protein, partial [Blastocatellia bacterium]
IQILCLAILLVSFSVICSAKGQDTVTGAFEGTVTNNLTGDPVEGARAEITNVRTGITVVKVTDARGRFYQGLLPPDVYRIKVSMPGFQPREVEQELKIARTGQVVPVPVTLDPLTAVAAPLPTAGAAATAIRASINTLDASRSGSFSEVEVSLLPLGATSLTGTFDDLALLLPGVAPPPQTQGSVAGPGQGAGVGSAGQFSVNGLRSRANNFTVDGSDNNDEDIGVRRQGFVALIPQPIESVKEYQAITLLSPAQFGRNLGAQVNAVSKSGGNQVHGSLYGFFNSSQLNARNFFDTANGAAESPLFTSSTTNPQPVLLDGQQIPVRNQSGGEDSFTFGKFGATLGGPVRREKTFYFLSIEGQIVNATREENFAVPTVEERGAFRSGAAGIFTNPFTEEQAATVPASRNGSAIFNLFPFPNHPQGIYGANTFTQELPAGERGLVFSVKLDHHFKSGGRQQSVTGRYNFTDDRRQIPATGEAIFSALEPRVRTQNFSFFFNSELSAPNAPGSLFNQARFSFGRTRLDFREAPGGREFLIPSQRFLGEPFLLNAPLLFNRTTPTRPGVANAGPVTYQRLSDITTVEEEIGSVGQVIIAGFSPLGVDVYNFPQQRVNNTYQLADELTIRMGYHSLAFGVDTRRTDFHSDLPRNSRPLVTFNGGPRLIPVDEKTFRMPTAADPNPALRPTDLAAFGAASNFFLTLNTTGSDSKISLRFYQFNFFGQDQWRLSPGLSLSYGLRYEYNTPPREMNRRIERTFRDPALDLAPDLRSYIEDRTGIFDADRNNFAPRLSLAWSPKLFGKDSITVIRAGYGLFYDQVLGAVVSQSRNVYPTFLPLNFGGGPFDTGEFQLNFFNPARAYIFRGGELVPLLQSNSLTRLNPELPLDLLLGLLKHQFLNALGVTLPSRRLATPMAHHYSLAIEQQLAANLVVSAAYVGTQGQRLLRFATPNLGPGANLVLTMFAAQSQDDLDFPVVYGRLNTPARPQGGIGAINRFETTASSRYDALQWQLRGRFRLLGQYQLSYTFSKALDDVSDVFDLAGASALPQNSLKLGAERGPAGFDLRHRFVYSSIYDFSALGNNRRGWRRLWNGLQVAAAGQIQTGQPFTVNSIFDVNLDGNLTDRLNTTNGQTGGLVVTGDARQPLRLTTDNLLSLLAPFGQDGQVGRNTFRAGKTLELNLAILKSLTIFARRQINLRVDFFNLTNQANFGIPARWLEAPGFGRATRTVTPGRRIQFSLKYAF